MFVKNIFVKTLTFNELRKIKDSLPEGSLKKIADKLGLTEESVRNYFGGTYYNQHSTTGIHTEKGPDGGIVCIDDSTILELALKIIDENSIEKNGN
jgi:hypothetical protein